MLNTDNAKRTIAFFVQGHDVQYGMHRGTMTLLNGLRNLGWNTTMICMVDGPAADQCRTDEIDVRCLGDELAPVLSGGLVGKASKYLQLLCMEKSLAPNIADILNEIGADGIHVRSPILVRIAGTAARIEDVPCFWHMPNEISNQYPFHLNQRIYRRLCQRRNVVPLANSRFTADSLGHDSIEPHILYVGVDAERFDPQNVEQVSRNDLGIPQDAVVLGIFARLTESKGAGRILDAMASMASTHPPLHLLIVGGPTDTPFARSLAHRVAEIQASDQLHLTGFVPDPQRYYGSIDIAVNSRIDPEPFGQSVVEAMLMERPVLVHSLGGPAEIIADRTTGWHVTQPTAQAFSQGITQALKDRSKWAEMGKQARKEALAKYSAVAMIQKYTQIVEQTLAQKVLD